MIFLLKVTVLQSEKFKELALSQWTSVVKIDAKRGEILDRNNNELAISGNVYRIDLDLNAMRKDVKNGKYTIEEISKDLAKAVDITQEKAYNIMTYKGADGKVVGYGILKRRAELKETEKVKEIIKKYEANGILISPDTKRYYVYGDFASQVIGHTNSDGVGLTGVELYYDDYLKGEPGKILEEKEFLKEELDYTFARYEDPVAGNDVVLTIDSTLQNIAEKYAKEAYSDNKAKEVSVIIADPNNGEILAMANVPGYDLNNPWVEGKSFDELQKSWRNRAVSDAYEPGSIFKVITALAALEEGVVKNGDQMIANCGGSFQVLGKTIHCWKRTGHGAETFLDILKDSCNVGFGKVGADLGIEKLCKYISLSGLGKKTGIDLPGETAGIVRKAENMTALDLATTSFGQSNTASMVQYLAAFNAVANGGTYITPHVLKEIVKDTDDGEKEVVKTFDKSGNKKVFSEDKTAELRSYLEEVVSEGGGKKAYIPGYKIAGKTGTAQVVDFETGGYGAGKYMATFAGMAPSDNPKFTVMVQILEPDPSNYYAGQIAAPVGQKIFNDIFNYYDIKPEAPVSEVEESLKADVIVPELRGLSVDDAKKILKDLNIEVDLDGEKGEIKDMNPKPGVTVKEGSKVILYTKGSTTYNKIVVMPDLNGYTKEKAEETLKSLGLKGKFNGTGLISDQSITKGTEVSVGATIEFTLEKIID